MTQRGENSEKPAFAEMPPARKKAETSRGGESESDVVLAEVSYAVLIGKAACVSPLWRSSRSDITITAVVTVTVPAFEQPSEADDDTCQGVGLGCRRDFSVY